MLFGARPPPFRSRGGFKSVTVLPRLPTTRNIPAASGAPPEKSRNGAGEMFWEVNRGGALILPGAESLVFMARRSRRCGAANQILASSSMLNPDSKREGTSRRGRSGGRGLGAGLGNDSPHRNSCSSLSEIDSPAKTDHSFSETLLGLAKHCSPLQRSVPAMSFPVSLSSLIIRWVTPTWKDRSEQNSKSDSGLGSTPSAVRYG